MPGDSRASTLRDFVLAFAIVGALLGGMFLYAGSWPPMVIIESGSMMHPQDAVPYGRYGTIDPGDIVLVKAVDGPEDVETWAEGGAERYGRSGDVLVFRPFNNVNATPIIHRAMAWVEVADEPGQPVRYHVHWVDGEVLTFGPAGIYMPELGFDERGGFTPESGYRPAASGWLTKGDNARTNPRADQAHPDRDRRLTDVVQPEWVIGVARGEIPWFGLLKLALAPTFNQVDPPASWMRVGNAFAPYDLWTMLGFCVILVVLAPLAVDVWRTWRDHRDAQRELARVEAEARDAADDASEPLPRGGDDAGAEGRSDAAAEPAREG